MSAATEILLDTYGRIKESVHASIQGLTQEQLTARIDPNANSIAWLVWHLTRVQDDHIAGVAGWEQVYETEGWRERFGLPFGMHIGYGHSSEQVAEVRGISAEDLAAYYDAVHERTLDYLRSLSDENLAEVVDTRWDPPVTLAVRLVSVASEDLQHAGQAAYARGIIERTGA